ncbi:ATP-binding protein [Streptomyces sp. NPDC004647]|uniref:ATP-binding protein n=1 Tax=Streptomyces sp. NPDC004647 TaxID=3154671 RepID=UPI0033BB2C86
MSLPLTRRIARAALLVAAGAAPLVGAAGTASAADLPSTATLGKVGALDGAHLGKTLDGTSKRVGQQAGDSGSKTVKSSVPKAAKTVGGVGKATAPAAQKAARDAAGTTRGVLGDTATTAQKTGGTQGLPSAGRLPVQGLPTGG